MPARPERGPGTVHAARAAGAAPPPGRSPRTEWFRKSYDGSAPGSWTSVFQLCGCWTKLSLERAVDLQVSSNFTPGMGVHQSYDWGFGQRLTVAHPSSGPRPSRSSPAGVRGTGVPVDTQRNGGRHRLGGRAGRAEAPSGCPFSGAPAEPGISRRRFLHTAVAAAGAWAVVDRLAPASAAPPAAAPTTPAPAPGAPLPPGLRPP